MKRILIFSFISICLLFKLKADIIYAPYTEYGLLCSIEGIGSYEIPLSILNTINFWGGIGVISAIYEFKYPALGIETGAEIRQYFSKKKYKNFNLGFYSGFAFMRYPKLYHGYSGYKNSLGFVPGIKLTRKIHNFSVD